MRDERPAILAIERATGLSYGANPLRVFVDGRTVGKIRRDRVAEFPVTPGEHSVVVRMVDASAGPLRVSARAGDRVELVCVSNQLPPNPLMFHAAWTLGAVFVVALISLWFPPVWGFVQANLESEMMLAGGLGFVGLGIYTVRAYRAGAIWLQIDLREKGGD